MSDNQYTKLDSECNPENEEEARQSATADLMIEKDDSYVREHQYDRVQLQDKPLLLQIIEQSQESHFHLDSQSNLNMEQDIPNPQELIKQVSGENNDQALLSQAVRLTQMVKMDQQNLSLTRGMIDSSLIKMKILGSGHDYDPSLVGTCACGARTQCLFNIENVYKQIGGFGNFQFLALILLAFIRNFALFGVYGAELAVMEPKYVCRQEGQDWKTCLRRDICDSLSTKPGFEYKFNREDEEFYENWFTKLDLTCADENSYGSIVSLYFIGYGAGVCLYQLPDKIGRMGTMRLVMPIQIIAFAMTVFGQDITTKALGSFFSGVFHIKISNCYTHIYELVQDQHRAISATIISFLDDSTLLIIGLSLKYKVRDLDVIFQWAWIVGTVTTFLYLVLIPESPKWLFFKEGPDSKRGIKALNYIASINRSQYRVPECARLDILGQAIIDHQSILVNQSIRNLQSFNNLNQTIINNIKETNRTLQGIEEQQPMQNEGQASLSKLYCNKKYSKKAIFMSILFASVMVTYFLGMYNSTKLQGNIFMNQIVFGIALSLGSLAGGLLGERDEYQLMKWFLFLTIIFSLSLKMLQLEPFQFYELYVGQVLILGALFPCLLIVQDRQIDSLFASMSLEINFCIASFCTSISPVFARLQEPYPTLCIISFSLIAVVAMIMIGRPDKESAVATLQRTIQELTETFALHASEDVKQRWIAKGENDKDNNDSADEIVN